MSLWFSSAFLSLALLAAAALAQTQPCNPLLDGTYCAEVKRPASDSPRGVILEPYQSIGRDLSPSYEEPATFGAITFRGDGTRCIGLLTRGRCK
jgi:hypothetical protein